MYKELVFLCCAIAFILVSTTEAKGGRGGGGRSSGRSSSRSSSGGGGFFSSRSSGKSSSGSGGFFSSSSGSKSSSGKTGFSSSSSSGSYKSSSVGGKSGSSFSGGWFHGFLHNAPYRYTYRPTHIVYGSSSSNTGSYQTPTQVEEVEQKKETSDYAVGYSISKALSSDFFSIFNVAHDVSKYAAKIKSKELLATTTQSPVATYDLNYIVKPPYTTTTSTTYGYDPKSYYPDDLPPSDKVDSKKDEENNDGIQESVGNTKKEFEVTSTESTTTKVDDFSLFSLKNLPKYNSLAEAQFSIAREDLENNDRIQENEGNLEKVLEVTSTESTTTKIDDFSFFSIYNMSKYNSLLEAQFSS